MIRNVLKVIFIISALAIIVSIYYFVTFKVNEIRMVEGFYHNNSNFKEREEIMINIPKIKIKAVVRKANNNFDNLDRGIVYYKKFDADDKNIIFGHSGMGVGTYFNRIDELLKNDKLTISTVNCNYNYVVKNIYLINDNDTWILEDKEKSGNLLLITCDKKEKNKRLVVEFMLEKA